jgi:hypothetical protein
MGGPLVARLGQGSGRRFLDIDVLDFLGNLGNLGDLGKGPDVG